MKRIVAFALVVILVAAGVGGVVLVFQGSGSSSSSTPSSTTVSTTSTTSAHFTGAGGQAFCAADARLNAAIAAEAPKTTDAAALQADYQRRVDAVKALEQVAPPEIKPDVTTVRSAYEALSPALASAGYDMSKVSQAERAAVQTPDVTRAGQRLAQYDQKVCKIGASG